MVRRKWIKKHQLSSSFGYAKYTFTVFFLKTKLVQTYGTFCCQEQGKQTCKDLLARS